MSSLQPVIIVLEPYGGSPRQQSPQLPFVFWDDAAVTRGDGVFESLLVRGGEPMNVQRHLERFASSARLLDLPEPDADYWLRATREAAQMWAERTEQDGKCTWTYTRGRRSTGHPTCWVAVQEISPRALRERDKGVSVMTAERGYEITARNPWTVVGAKTLNYASTMAALRYARAHDYDDVVYVAGDRVLEGATSTLVAVPKLGKLRTPEGDVLPGTTQDALFAHASAQGWRCKRKPMTVADLRGAESVWLVSSTRIAARVTAIDGEKLPKPSKEHVKEVFALIDAALA